MNVIGDVANKTCVLVDDMVDTAGRSASRRSEAARRLSRGYITHPCSRARGPTHPELGPDEIVVTTPSPSATRQRPAPHPPTSVAELLAETLRRINEAESVSSLYLD